jgi:hypothetical protein
MMTLEQLRVQRQHLDDTLKILDCQDDIEDALLDIKADIVRLHLTGEDVIAAWKQGLLATERL